MKLTEQLELWDPDPKNNEFKKNLVIDFDGVLHMYTSPWLAEHIIADGAVPGAMEFLIDATSWDEYRVIIYSGRSRTREGVAAMSNWIEQKLIDGGLDEFLAISVMRRIKFASEKPAGYITIDDRCFHFVGTFPSKLYLDTFKPWNRS